MQRLEIGSRLSRFRIPWNKGKLVEAKPPLRWSIWTKLQMESRTRDLALFNFAIDSKLKGCNFVSLKIEDVAPNGTVDRQNWTQFSRTVGVASSRGDDLLAAGQLRGQTLWRPQPRLRLRADGNLYQGGGIVVGLSYV